MTGPRLFHAQKQEDKVQPKPGPTVARSRASRMLSWFLAVSTAASSLSGMNINNLGPNKAMAQAGGKVTVVAEDVKVIQKQAAEAADAFRSYIITGDESYRTRFWRIYNNTYKGKQFNELAEFMSPFRDAMGKVVNDPLVVPIYDAFKAGISLTPSLYTEFMEAVYEVRSALARAVPATADVDALAARVKAAEGKIVKAYDQIGKVREKMAEGRDVSSAARWVLMEEDLGFITSKHGIALVNALRGTIPKERAAMAVDALKNYVLTGEESQFITFKALWEANKSNATFIKEMTAKFKEKISEETENGKPTALSRVVQGFRAAVGFDPGEFADFVKDLYAGASRPNASLGSIDAMMVEYVNGIRPDMLPAGMSPENAIAKMRAAVISPLLDIVARGKARQAISYMIRVLDTGDANAAAEFAKLYDSTFLGQPIEENAVFFKEFNRLYNEEIRQSEKARTGAELRTLGVLVADFERNALPIAIRDIYTELLKATPDMARLETRYGTDFVTLIAGRMAAGELDWLLRDGTELNTQLERRAAMGDQTATWVKSWNVADKAGVLSRTYAFIAKENAAGRKLDDYATVTIDQNFDQLSWLSGTQQQVQRELANRMRQNDPNAIAILAHYNNNAQQAAQVLAPAYARLKQLREEAGITQNGIVATIAANMDAFQWVAKPVALIGKELERRRYEPVVASIHQSAGFSYGTMAVALKEIYGGTLDRKNLVAAYGEELVSLVESKRAGLGWLSGDVKDIENGLRTRKDDVTRALRGHLKSYSAPDFVESVAIARAAVMRPGAARADALDAFGYQFLESAAAREAEVQPPITGEDLEGRKVALKSRWKLIDNDIIDLERQLNYPMLEPAKGLFFGKIAGWRAENERIRLQAEGTTDSAELAALEQDQERLLRTMVSPLELRKSVEMAFAMIHLAETGRDVSGMIGAATTGTMGTLLAWYGSLEGVVGGKEKQAVLGDVVAAVLEKARPELARFIGSMNERGVYQAMSETYAMTQGRGGTDRAGLVNEYGSEFVSSMEMQAPHLRMLESLTVSQLGIAALRMDKNDLFAAIIIRCYRAIANPQGTENKELMVRLFGSGFVAEIEKNRAAFEPLGRAGAGLSEVMAAFNSLDRPGQEALWGSYASAYKRSVGSLMRAYRKQDNALFDAINSIYSVAIRRPREGAPKAARDEYERNMKSLKDKYGDALVNAVQNNMKALRFLEGSRGTVESMRMLDENTLGTLNAAFEQGPGLNRTNFMANFRHVAAVIPGIYLQLSNAMLYTTPTDQLGTMFAEAVQLYRQEFGSNDYLFNQYVNLPLLNESLPKLGTRGAVPSSINTPEDLVAFLRSADGQQMIATGRKVFESVKTEYLMMREQQNFNPETGPFTTEAVMTLTNNLSITDALYIGIALQEIQGTRSAFGQRAAAEFMNTLLVIAQTDPYLVGPYIMQVLPALISVSQDEDTLVMGMMAFRTIFSTRYGEGMRNMAYSTANIRKYFLEYFKRIDERLPEIVAMFDHGNLEDELRQVPEARTDEGYMSPFYYRYKQGWWQYNVPPIPMLYGQPGGPLDLLPQPTMPLTPYNPVGRGITLDSDARGHFSRLSDRLVPPTDRMFNYGVPARFRIGAIGKSTLIRRLNELAGPMPVDYQDYWLTKEFETGAFYAAGGTEAQTGAGTTGITETTAYGGGLAGTQRGITGGAQAIGTAETTTTTVKEVTTESVTGAEEQRAQTGPVYGTSSTKADFSGSAGGVPGGPGWPVPLPLVGLYPGNVLTHGNEVGIHNAQQEFHYESTSATMGVPGTVPTGAPTTEEVKTVEKTKGLLSSSQRFCKENKTDMVLWVSGERVPELRGPTRQDITQDDLVNAGANRAALPPDTQQLNQDLWDMDNSSDQATKTAAATRVQQQLAAMGITMDAVNDQRAKRQGDILQREQGRMKSRLYFITQEGNIYNLAYGHDTEVALNNYLFANMNRQEALASFKFIGREMWPGLPLSDAEYRQRARAALTAKGADQATVLDKLDQMPRSEVKKALETYNIKEDQITEGVAGGFDGAAIGFTLPTESISDEKYIERAAEALEMDKEQLSKMPREQIAEMLKKKGISERVLKGGDALSSLVFGELVRNIQTMDPVHAEQAVGMAVTNLLDNMAQRDIYAAFYRGAEIVELKEDDRTQIDTTKHAETTVDVMWRTMRIHPLAVSREIRVVGGYPTTAGAMARWEWPQGMHGMRGLGITAARNEADLLREYLTISADAEGIYSSVKSTLVQLYGYDVNEASRRGALIALDYMQSRLENRITKMPVSEKEKNYITQHYGSLLLMAWADRHGILVGGQRVPGYTIMTNSINQAMTEIQNNPANAPQIMRNLAKDLRNQFNQSIWRFSLGYGYDGETTRLYVVASAEIAENIGKKLEEVETSGGEAKVAALPENITSGTLYSLALFGRPTDAYLEAGTHFYGQAPLVISRESDASGAPTGKAVATYDPSTPFVDLWGGFGVVDQPMVNLMRFEKKVAIRSEADAAGALRDAYREVGSRTYNDHRITHLYGEGVLNAVAKGKEKLSWMVRPQAEIASELKQKIDAEDPAVRYILSLKYGGRMTELTKQDYNDAAGMIRDIYIELRKNNPDIRRLQSDYGATVVDVVASRAMDLDWVLLPQESVRREFDARAGNEGTVERQVSDEMSLAPRPQGTELTGTQVQRLCENNLVDTVVGITNADSRAGVGADKYDVILGKNLKDEEEEAIRQGKQPPKRDGFYILMTPAAPTPNSRGSIMIGNADDLNAWNKAGFYIGAGIVRLDIKPDELSPGDYTFVFSGDRRLTLLNSEKIVGGITLPLTKDEYDRWKPEKNWTLGGLVNVLQSHQVDVLAGALYGLRQYGDVQWDQITTTANLRWQIANTATYVREAYFYTFFNKTTKQVVLATKDVWDNEAELRQVCALSGCDIKDLRRQTVGAGMTWAETDIIAGNTFSVHFFFEGGTEQSRQYRQWGSAVQAEVAADMLGNWGGTEFIARGGLAVSWARQDAGSVLGETYTLGITGARGSWPVVPGQITRPEYLNVWLNDTDYMGWWIMAYGKIQW